MTTTLTLVMLMPQISIVSIISASARVKRMPRPADTRSAARTVGLAARTRAFSKAIPVYYILHGQRLRTHGPGHGAQPGGQSGQLSTRDGLRPVGERAGGIGMHLDHHAVGARRDGGAGGRGDE